MICSVTLLLVIVHLVVADGSFYTLRSERANSMYQFLGSFCVKSPMCSDDFGVKEGSTVGEFVAAFRERIPTSADDVEGALSLLWEAAAVAHDDEESRMAFVEKVSLRLLGYVDEAFKHRQRPSQTFEL
jgi:hypothetical protein